jgi:hypothetical protein
MISCSTDWLLEQKRQNAFRAMSLLAGSSEPGTLPPVYKEWCSFVEEIEAEQHRRVR